MAYLDDPRELQIRPESGVTLEQDNRFEEMYHWGAMVLDLCNLPVEEYMKPMTVNIGEGGDGGGSTPSNPKHTLKYIINGEVVKTVSLEEGAGIQLYTPQSQAGKTFDGWYSDANCTTQFTATTMPAQNVQVYGRYITNTNKVTFIIDGEFVGSGMVEYNQTVSDFPITEKEGYTFSGWRPSETTKITKDTTFSGSYIVNQYTLAYYVDNIMVSGKTYDYNAVIEKAAKYEKVGYTSTDWVGEPNTMPANNVSATCTTSIMVFTVVIKDTENNLVYSANDITYGTLVQDIIEQHCQGYVYTGSVTTITDNITIIVEQEVPVTMGDAYYGILLNSDFDNLSGGTYSALTQMEITNEINRQVSVTVMNAEDLGRGQEYQEMYIDEEDDEFMEEWDNTYTYSFVVLVPSTTIDLTSLQQGVVSDQGNWIGTVNDRGTDKNTFVVIDGITYKAYSFRRPNYCVNDIRENKTFFLTFSEK